MTFSSIVLKNIRYNIKNYLSFYIINSLIVAIILFFNSLIYVDILPNELLLIDLKPIISIAFNVISLFAIIFITLTFKSLIKYRGKEFGIYLSLGMTSKNLITLIWIENTIITIFSLITGIISGIIFSKLFYNILCNILSIKLSIYTISFNSYIMVCKIFLLISIINNFVNSIYLYRLSILKIIKSTSKKDIENPKPLLTLIILIIFIIALIMFPTTLNYEKFFPLSKETNILFLIILVLPLFLIGSLFNLVKVLFKFIPNLYNKNLLFITNLMHRFSSYKKTLYITSMLMLFTLVFITFSVLLLNGLLVERKESYPYDIMFVQSKKITADNNSKIKKIITNNGGLLKKYTNFEATTLPISTVTNNHINKERSLIISESAYNSYMNCKLEIDDNEIICLDLINNTDINFNSISLSFNTDSTLTTDIPNNNIKYTKENIRVIQSKFINKFCLEGERLYFTYGYVVDDTIYNKITHSTQNNRLYFNLINFYSFNKLKITKKLLDEFVETNKTIYNEKYENDYPIISREIALITRKQENATSYFCILFITILFFISGEAILYHKVIADIDDNKKQIYKLKRIGITHNETISLLSKELKTLFFTPLVVGTFLSTYFVAIIIIPSHDIYNNIITSQSLKILFSIYILYLFVQIFFYIAIKKKYVREIL